MPVILPLAQSTGRLSPWDRPIISILPSPSRIDEIATFLDQWGTDPEEDEEESPKKSGVTDYFDRCGLC